MSAYQPHLSLVTLSLRPTQHLKTQDGYTPLWETSRQQRGVACAECIPYLAIDRGKNGIGNANHQRCRLVLGVGASERITCLLSNQNGGSFARFGDETSQRYLGTSYYRLESTATHFGKREEADSRVATV